MGLKVEWELLKLNIRCDCEELRRHSQSAELLEQKTTRPPYSSSLVSALDCVDQGRSVVLYASALSE